MKNAMVYVHNETHDKQMGCFRRFRVKESVIQKYFGRKVLPLRKHAPRRTPIPNGFSRRTYETVPNITSRVRLLHLGGKHATI